MVKYHVPWTLLRLLASQCRQNYGAEISFQNRVMTAKAPHKIYLNDAVNIVTNTASNSTTVSGDELTGRWVEKFEE